MKITINGVEAERRYLTNWGYNSALILDALEKIVIDNGGELVSTWKNCAERKVYAISNRQLSAAIKEKEDFVRRLEMNNRPAATEERRKLKELIAIDNEPILSYHGDYHYTAFVLDGIYYYYQTDSNPFFDFLYCKTFVENGEIDQNTYHHEDKKEWLYDCFFRWDCRQEYRVEAAKMILDMLKAADPCKKARPARLAKLHTINGGCM